MSKSKFLRARAVKFFLLVGDEAEGKPETWFESDDHPHLLFRPLMVGEMSAHAGADATLDMLASALIGSRGDFALALSLRRADMWPDRLAALDHAGRVQLLREGVTVEESGRLVGVFNQISGVGREEKNA